MSDRWNQPGIPHKGWKCREVVDVRGDDEPSEEAAYEVCQMCGQERIRFVHVMRHDDLQDDLHVGCICAEKMSGDHVGPKYREKNLRNRVARRSKWLTGKWKRSKKGNLWIKAGDYHVVVYANLSHPGKYQGVINEKRGVRL